MYCRCCCRRTWYITPSCGVYCCSSSTLLCEPFCLLCFISFCLCCCSFVPGIFLGACLSTTSSSNISAAPPGCCSFQCVPHFCFCVLQDPTNNPPEQSGTRRGGGSTPAPQKRGLKKPTRAKKVRFAVDVAPFAPVYASSNLSLFRTLSVSIRFIFIFTTLLIQWDSQNHDLVATVD